MHEYELVGVRVETRTNWDELVGVRVGRSASWSEYEFVGVRGGTSLLEYELARACSTSSVYHRFDALK